MMRSLRPEYLVAEDIREAVWLRLRRLTSSNLCATAIRARGSDLDSELLARKGAEVAYSVRSALGYWESRTGSLNARILTRYYALLQITIAEEIADPRTSAELRKVQSRTEQGHGLTSLTNPEFPFPNGYMIGCLRAGHFFEYCKFRDIDLSEFALDKRPRKWTADLTTKMVSLKDLLRRIPELQAIIEETFGEPSLSFHVTAEAEVFSHLPEGQTRLIFHPASENVTSEYLSDLGLPVHSIQPHKQPVAGGDTDFFSILDHDPKVAWWQVTNPYKSGYSGTSLIAPLWGTTDPMMLHLAILYGLSIVVRYLPLQWYEVEHGPLNHLRALLEYYVSIVDNVLPVLAIERITGRGLRVTNPDSMFGPL